MRYDYSYKRSSRVVKRSLWWNVRYVFWRIVIGTCTTIKLLLIRCGDGDVEKGLLRIIVFPLLAFVIYICLCLFAA